jgi:chromosomal replication initiator protein
LTEDLAPELVDRLLGGVSWGLTPPDAGTRLNILKTKSSSLGLIMAEPVLRHLAETLRGNVRELEGALNSLKHYSLVTKRCVDLGLVREALADLLRHSLRVVQLADIDATVCRILQLPGGSLQSSARNWMVSHPRMLAMLLARKHTAAAYSEVGRYFGGRTHSTAVAAEKKVRQWMRDRESMTVGDQRIPVCEVIELVERELMR